MESGVDLEVYTIGNFAIVPGVIVPGVIVPIRDER